MFRKKASPRLHIRCPVCGRLARVQDGKTLPTIVHTEHEVEARVQTFPSGARGGGPGFAWSRRPLALEEILSLDEVVSRVASRLRKMVYEKDSPLAAAERARNRAEFETAANDYITEAEREFNNARMELDFRKQEMALVGQRWRAKE